MSRNVSFDLSTPERINGNINLDFHGSIVHQDDTDDDVIFVSENVNGVIDLCTPEPLNYASTDIASLNRRHSNVNQLASRRRSNRLISRRRLSVSDSRSFQSIPEEPNAKSSNAIHMVEDKTLPDATILICPICMESPIHREPTATPCGHIFCKICLEQSLNVNPKCPICRTKVNRKRLVRLYIENFLN